MDNSVFDVIVIGGGHSGLSISYYLKQQKRSHLLLERHRIGNSWRSQRWDSFKLNTPNKMSCLPGLDNNVSDPDGFSSAQEFVSVLEQYAKALELPVMENSNVLSVEKSTDSDLFYLTVSTNGGIQKYRSKNVVVASGIQNRKIIPELSRNVSPEILQLHTAEYRNANSLPNGAVLVVGSGQSGVQIAEDLLDSGKKVFISTSRVARVPRRYRGKDIMEWMDLTGFMDQYTKDITDPQVFEMRQPQISGVGPKGKTVSLQSLAARGAVILGKTAGADGVIIHLQPNAADHVKFGDEFSQKIKGMIEGYISKVNIDAPAPKPDEADIPDENADCASHETTLDLKKHNITSIIMEYGFRWGF